MPSPLAHATMGYVVYRMARPRMPQADSRRIGPLPMLLMATVGLSVLPDVDAVFGIMMGDLGRFHNHLVNTPLFGLLIALVVASLVWLKQRSGFLCWFLVALVSYELHIFMDVLTDGRGVMLLWPFSLTRYQSPVILFYGLHWSDGLISPRHLVTLVTELGFVLFVGVILRIVPGRHGSLRVSRDC